MDCKAASSAEELSFSEQKSGHVVLQWMQRLKKTNKISQSESDSALARYHLYTMELSSTATSTSSSSTSSSISSSTSSSFFSSSASTTAFPPPSSSSTLQVVLTNPILMEEFAKFTIEEWSVENVLFYSQVEMFKSTFQEAAPLAFEKAKRICKEFIMPGSPMEINVDCEIKRGIIEMIKREKLCGDMFQDAQRQVFSLMEADTFPKWQKTSSFKDATDKVLAHHHHHHQQYLLHFHHPNSNSRHGSASPGPRRCQSQENGLNLRVSV